MKYDERRDFARMPAECKLSYRLAGDAAYADGACVNISGSGVLFHGPVPLQPGKAAEIRLFPDNRITPPLTAYIEVIHCQEAGDGQYAIGGAIKGIKSE